MVQLGNLEDGPWVRAGSWRKPKRKGGGGRALAEVLCLYVNMCVYLFIYTHTIIHIYMYMCTHIYLWCSKAPVVVGVLTLIEVCVHRLNDKTQEAPLGDASGHYAKLTHP